MRLKFLFQSIACLTVFLLAAVGGGCGGGSKGTGGVDFEGRVVAPDGSALAGVLVTIVASGDSQATDQDGSFQISTVGVSGNVEIMVDTARFSGVTVIPDIPESARLVTLYLEVNDDEGSLLARDITVDQDEHTEDSENGEREDSNDAQPDDRKSSDDGSNSDSDSGDDDRDRLPASTPSPMPTPDSTQVPDEQDQDGEDHSPDDSGDGVENPDDDGGSSGGDGSEDEPGDGEDAEGEGRISALGDATFTVDGIEFTYDANTRFYDQDENLGDASILALGIRVHAKGEWRSGHAVATRVEVKG